MLTVQCDFDDTITVSDLGAELLKNLAPNQSTWRKVDEDYRAGRISVEECQRSQFARMKIGPKEVQRYAIREVEMRPGFSQAVEYCRNEGIRFVIVSNGLDLYIDSILENLGLADLERYSGQARITDVGIAVDYVDPMGTQLTENFKTACLKYLRAGNQPVVCIGDSVSDIPPALGADHVIARSELLNHFQRHQLPYLAFETFYDVQHHLQNLLHSLSGAGARPRQTHP
ncbi:MAG: MtnX-like HAD-IB family phosphatase [Dehalococcoidia bacterium]|nr:MtnX-like HAD-IB family phosphatase [Dehalococcoidia bacterium]